MFSNTNMKCEGMRVTRSDLPEEAVAEWVGVIQSTRSAIHNRRNSCVRFYSNDGRLVL